MKFARLKPYNGKAHVLKSYTAFGIKFQEKNGWYQVEDDVAEYLKTCVQIQEDPTSTKAFDVVDTLEEAEEIDELEKKRAERAMAREARPTKRIHQTTARTSGDLTTKDLPRVEGRKKVNFDDEDGTFPEDGKDMAPRAKRPENLRETEDTEPVQKSDEVDDEEDDEDEVEETEADAPAKPSKAPPAPRGVGRSGGKKDK